MSKKKNSKGWTEERRRKQAENIRKTKPWEKSTGPRTEKGKLRSKYNALKHGHYTDEFKIYKDIMMHHENFMRAVRIFDDTPDREETIRLLFRYGYKAAEQHRLQNEQDDQTVGTD